MERRHVFFGVVFVAVFGIGMANVMSDGRLGHTIASQLPGHTGDGEASIEKIEKIQLEPGERVTREVKLENVKRVSYRDPTIFANGTDPLNFSLELSPSPRMVEQSLPPNYVYEHREARVDARLSFRAEEVTEPGQWTFRLDAKPGGIRTEEISRDIPVEIVPEK